MEYRSPLLDSYGDEGPIRHGSYNSRFSPYHPGATRRYYPEYQRGYYRGSPIDDGGPSSSHHSQPTSHYGQPNYDRGPSFSTHSQPKYSNRFKVTSYPRELTELFQAQDCKLCGVQVQSPIVAKMHYSGKQHAKKVKSFLTEWCLKTGCPMPEVENPAHSSASGTTLGNYCEICDVTLTSVNDKLLHYAGKTHQKNERDPTNAKRKKKSYETIDLSNVRFGIGTDFSNNNPANKIEAVHQNYVCEMCNVKALSEEQLQAHLSGKKHKEKMEKKDTAVPKPEKSYKCEICNLSFDTSSFLQLHENGKRHRKNVEKLELTEETADYCDVCNVSFTSFEQYHMHMQGKKHEKKCREECSKTVKTSDEKMHLTCKYCPYIGIIENHVCDKSLMKIDHEDLHNKWVCYPCHNMMFNSEQQLSEHKKSRRHLLCILNQVEGEKIVEELKYWYCFTCKKQCKNHKDYTDHLFEEKHMTLTSETTHIETKTDLFLCTVCNIMMDNQAKDEHMKDIKHLKQSLQKDIISTLTKIANENISTSSFRCANCNVTLNCFVKYSEHLLSDIHMDQVLQEKMQHF